MYLCDERYKEDYIEKLIDFKFAKGGFNLVYLKKFFLNKGFQLKLN